MASSILLTNATLLVPSGEANDYVVALRHHSLLIEGNKIVRISSEIAPPSPHTEILDCTGKIISPGFIDTHHHLWQTQLKGRHANHTLMEYMSTAANGVEATVASGIRSIFCYTPTIKLKAWKPELVPADDMLGNWVHKQLDEFATSAPWADGRVHLGLAFDGYSLPKEVVIGLHERARKAGVKLITAHCVHGYFSDDSLVDIIDSYGLLGPDFLLSHATNLTEGDVEKLRKANAWISSTPDTELQMGMGNPVCFREGCTDISSLGIDCHSNNSSSIPTQMRVALQCERARRNDTTVAQGKYLRSLNVSVQDAFKLGTIQGARAIHMDNKVGSITAGKLADLVIFDAQTPGMICASEEDPVAAIVLHSSIRDIDTVIVDGRICKQNGRLVPVNVNTTLEDAVIAKQRVDWGEVAQQLLSSRRRIQAAIEKAGANDFEHMMSGTMKMLQIAENKFV
ncbi:unnamed protein product [Penicillium egyptiacum]|uniref:Amidohydrolase-related domain-containing protein n=1 Tax=Penicillium egyptiacum TaxID=1303716 RepID=A0A9W4P015_9EURO|nr:unnamed protein product [Penicillium egyptiacum]